MAKIIPIKENHLFSKVYAKGKKASGYNVSVYALKNYRTTQTCLGITTSKKLGNAVQRSRARRLIRAAWQDVTKNRTFSRPYLIVVVAKSPIIDSKRKCCDVVRDLQSAFQKLQLISDNKEN